MSIDIVKYKWYEKYGYLLEYKFVAEEMFCFKMNHSLIKGLIKI